MTEKKETAKKATPKAVAKKAQPAKSTQPVNVEQKYFAKDLADQMGVSTYDFLLIKRENGLRDDSQLTASEMKELYNKTIRR